MLSNETSVTFAVVEIKSIVAGDADVDSSTISVAVVALDRTITRAKMHRNRGKVFIFYEAASLLLY